MMIGALWLMASALSLASAGTTVEKVGRQERGWFGAFLFFTMAGLVTAFMGLRSWGYVS